MAVVFAHAMRHAVERTANGPDGRLVLSQVARGDSPIFCATPSVKFVLEGEERYEVDGVVHVVRPGEFLMVDAGVELHAVLPLRVITTGLCVYMPAHEAVPYVPPGREREACGPRAGHAVRAVVQSARASSFGRRLDAVARRVARDPKAGPDLAAWLVGGAANEFLGLSAEVAQRLDSLDASKPSTRVDLLRRLDAARGFLHDVDDRVVPLDELAALAGMSQFHLARTFRSAFGLPPAHYHRALRLDRAARELESGRASASAAALRYGFSDLTAFSRAFKRRHGVSPGRYPASV